MTSATLITRQERSAPLAGPGSRRTYSCSDCGHGFRISGLGRHRVYFEPGDDGSDQPIINRVCSACGHGLPGKNAR